VEHALERLWAVVDEAAAAQLQRGASWAEDASPGELLASLELRLRERMRLLYERDRARTLRRLAARQVTALGQAGGWQRPASTSAHAVAQRMGELLIRDETGARDGEDLALWAELLGAAADALHGPAGSAGWVAQLPDLPPLEARETGSIRFVVPLDDRYALISPRHPSPVRVMEKRVALDAAVECAVFLEHGDFETLPLARLDVDPLFAGLSAEPAWYATERRAELQVIARVEDGWIARLSRRGLLRRTGADAWDPERSDGGRLRVLGTLLAPPPEGPWSVGQAPGSERVFCGLRTLPVNAPVAGCSTAWLRVPAQGGWAADAVRAEEEFMRGVARKVPFTVPVWAGAAHLASRQLQGPLYVPPLGMYAADLAPLEAWLRANSGYPMVSAVARLWLRVTGAGWALGAYHGDAFTFVVWWSGGAAEGPLAQAMVTAAPFAVRLGQYHRRVPPQEQLFPDYARLGCRVVSPAAAQGDVALPSSELRAFAVFALDALANKPLPLAGVVPCEALAEMIPEFADRFAHPETATRLAAVLRPKADMDWIARFVQTLAANRTRDAR
jgi:hypothetical protein